MVEVFKTDVSCPAQAAMLVGLIHNTFPGYAANFDLEDCDRILRIVTESRIIQCSRLIRLLTGQGHTASVLPDEVPLPRLKHYLYG